MILECDLHPSIFGMVPDSHQIHYLDLVTTFEPNKGETLGK